MQVADINREVKTIVVLALVCLACQLLIAPNVALGNGRANFALVFAGCVALSMGGRKAVVSGFVGGLVFDLATTGPIGLMALCLSVASFVLGIEERDRISGEPWRCVITFCVAALAVSLAYHLAMLLVGQTSSVFDVVVFRTLPTTLLTIVAFVPFALILDTRRGSLFGSGAGSHFSRHL